MTNKFVTDVMCCARCGNDHRALQFAKLTTPITFDTMSGVEQMTHWALCPDLNEPILLGTEGSALREEERGGAAGSSLGS